MSDCSESILDNKANFLINSTKKLFIKLENICSYETIDSLHLFLVTDRYWSSSRGSEPRFSVARSSNNLGFPCWSRFDRAIYAKKQNNYMPDPLFKY